MKLFLKLLIFSIGLNARANSFKEYSPESTSLLTYVVTLCPKEVAEALERKIHIVYSASQTDTRTSEGYTQDMVVKITTAPSPMVREIREYAELHINRKASLIIAADGGPNYSTKCTLIKK